MNIITITSVTLFLASVVLSISSVPHMLCRSNCDSVRKVSYLSLANHIWKGPEGFSTPKDTMLVLKRPPPQGVSNWGLFCRLKGQMTDKTLHFLFLLLSPLPPAVLPCTTAKVSVSCACSLITFLACVFYDAICFFLKIVRGSSDAKPPISLLPECQWDVWGRTYTLHC